MRWRVDYSGWQDSILIGLFEKRWKVTTTAHYAQNFNSVIQNPVENDVLFQRYSSEVGTNKGIAFAAIWESNKLLAFSVESKKKALSCFKAILGEVVSNFVQISAGKNVDNITHHAYA